LLPLLGLPRQAGVDYSSQTTLLHQMNGALAAKMQEIYEENQALVG